MERKGGLIRVFSTQQRLVHWVHTGTFAALALTGLFLYFQDLRPFAIGDAGEASRFVHRMGALLMGVLPLLYLLTDYKNFFASMKRLLTWSKIDLGWLKAAPGYYFLGDEKAMPPQDKFNTGQKLFYLLVALGYPVFGVTGLLMWGGRGSIDPLVFMGCVFLHDLMAIAWVAFFLVHFALSVMHPFMKGALDGMLFGWVPEDYVKHHHAKYYAEIAKEDGQ
ncbi:MAG: cytochrome b/b6 domain-containing protein [Chloroflexi bacterium]|nr:cytochrome b/b6 domain-containing protein [Chloroflexota bacterium]MBU1750193.1 cytochrome b/b6 domain-containing protein [Chloroflexota bacterium]